MENYSIRVENVFKHFEQKGSSSGMGGLGKKKKVKAVDGISMCVKPGEIIGIIGESGCGKSTLGKLLIKLEDTSSGQIFVDGKEINKFYKEDKLKFRREVQMVFQNPFDTFDPRYTIQKILMEVLDIHHIGENKEEKNKIIVEGLESVELKPAEDYMDRRPHELSGGQLQRISILRAMLLKPKILISDEPVSMLDVSVRADVIRMLQNLARENNTTLLFISHDINTVRYISDRVIVMYLGRIVEEGVTDDVLHNPQHPYTKALISNCSSIDVFEKKEKIKVNGEPPSPIDNGPGCYFAPRCICAAEKCYKTYPGIVDVTDTHKASCHMLTVEGN